jgi:hypothetical protein
VLGEAFEAGLVADAVLAESEAQAAALWRIRHSVSEGSKRAGYVVSHDSAAPLEQQAASQLPVRPYQASCMAGCACAALWLRRRSPHPPIRRSS